MIIAVGYRVNSKKATNFRVFNCEHFKKQACLLHNVELIKKGKSKEERFEVLSDICKYQLDILNNAEKLNY